MKNNGNIENRLRNTGSMNADEIQALFEDLCTMDEDKFQKLWNNSEIYAKLKKFFNK